MVLVAIVAIGTIVFLGADIASAFQAISNAL
jgi:Flp pilus assembly pilin Flp